MTILPEDTHSTQGGCPGHAHARQDAAARRISINRRWPAEGCTRVPNWVYSDPDIFQKEMDLFFAGDTWSYVGLECEVPQVGSYRRQWIGTRPVIMVRGKDGQVHVLENRCAHRQALICWNNSGQVKDFTCPYHQWNFALDGKLQGLPFKRGALGKGGMPADFDMAANSLKQLRVVNRGGSIWATFSDSAPSFEAYCGDMVLAEIDHMFPSDRTLRLLGYTRQLIPANWKTYLENLKDPYHATLLHTFYITFGLWRADSRSECIPQGGGKHSVMISHNEGKKTSAATAEMANFRGDFELLDKESVTPRKEFNHGRVGGAWVFPSTNLGIQANTLKVRHVIPRGPAEFELVFTHYGFDDDDEEMQRLRLKHANLLGPAGFVSMDDSEMLKQVQSGATGYPHRNGVIEMGGRGLEPADYMVTEVMIRAFWDFYRKEMAL
ncbi:aromatic ring-hydroxylating dioxygenase subunit alpha [Bordetella sp. BOR01]|uniref:aromatic ring-hydroxylating dioxygenase subunit alpha n=1 Tax=Bordetella sp. BOR01 TaxID=2854779 RepID=UPI001C43FBE1|nr:aromatic ring-hydroxylating dioxygenase subunit alpha [Bordetella sp. BOR01]